jgi:hypothetical protein
LVLFSIRRTIYPLPEDRRLNGFIYFYHDSRLALDIRTPKSVSYATVVSIGGFSWSIKALFCLIFRTWSKQVGLARRREVYHFSPFSLSPSASSLFQHFSPEYRKFFISLGLRIGFLITQGHTSPHLTSPFSFLPTGVSYDQMRALGKTFVSF